MSKFIGRNLNVGLGKEATRGTGVAATHWLSKVDAMIDNVVEVIDNEGNYGRIEDTEGADVVETRSEGNIRGRITDDAIGELLMAALGTSASPATVGGETIVYDHVFTILNSAVHPSLSMAIEEPNATGSSGLRMIRTMLDSLEINLALRQYGMFAASFRGDASATATNTPSYAAENYFRPQDGIFKLATTQSGLDGAGAVSVKAFNLTINKNIEDDYVIGSKIATDRLNKQFSIEGTVELLYDDRTYIDTIMIGDVYRALRFKFTNTDVTLGVGSNPDLEIDLHRCKVREVARSTNQDDLVSQTLQFKAHYSLTDSALITATLRNLVSAQY